MRAQLTVELLRAALTGGKLPLDPGDPSPEIEEADHLAQATDAIRSSDAKVWFEARYREAKTLAGRFPACRVYAPTGHLRLVEDD